MVSLTPTDTWSRIRSSLMIQQLNTKEYSTITANDRISVLCRGARTSSNSRSMKPDIAPQGRFARPWRIVPQEVIDNRKKISAYWKTLCEKYPAEQLATMDRHRGASPSGREQWACTLRRPADSSGEAWCEEETQAYKQAPTTSASLCAHVPARSGACSSVHRL